MFAKSISVLVADKLAAKTPQAVVDIVVDQLTQKEITRRAEALAAALKLNDEAVKESFKLKADVINYNEDGTIATSTWSKAKIDEKKKLQDRLDKIERAIVKATEKDDWGDLFNLKGGDKPTEKAEKTADDAKATS